MGGDPTGGAVRLVTIRLAVQAIQAAQLAEVCCPAFSIVAILVPRVVAVALAVV